MLVRNKKYEQVEQEWYHFLDKVLDLKGWLGQMNVGVS
jgi:hypothetical protein